MNEMIEMVENINSALFESASEVDSLLESLLEENPPLELRSNGYCTLIIYFGNIIWSSDEDERPYNEAADSYMPLSLWIIQEIQRISAINTKLSAIANELNENEI